MNGADSLCDTLLAHGIDVCFANPGTSEMHFVAALDRKPEMRCVLGLFEGVVTGAADGYGRMADKPAATLLHLGSGLGNGIANLHNARRAFTPMVNIVGDHATYHLQYDAPLTSDIEGLARPVSGFVRTTKAAEYVASDATDAIEAAWGAPGQIATLILPADAAWNEVASSAIGVRPRPLPAQADAARIKEVAAALRSSKRSMLFLSGKALRAEALELASRIAQTTGARLLAQQSNGRMERGAGRVAIERIRYRAEDATADLADVDQLILVGAKEPVAFFAYPDKPSTFLRPDAAVLELASNREDLLQALQALADELGVAAGARPLLNARGEKRIPTGNLDADKIATIIGGLMPENAIVIDEAITSARDFFKVTHGAAPHDFLQLTGGAIGIGLPLATGAAVACPDRKVIALQADGSGMYTLQALWSHARERLDIVTVIFANQRYAILHNEFKNVGAGVAGRNASTMLDLVDPTLDWVSLAKGVGVEGARATTAEEFADLFASATKRRGPFLIEAMI
ncbi:acetolactate synthase large subunit [Arvimicrobium flavum]|uniref:acetolactate synthase large subunit n=1 Tax=Arvimicrobium flavum TaxID=3393320 RepID=UPI00237C49A4|nr:acetolactate synthase large subunit [Mesorhizobium shangrilense]